MHGSHGGRYHPPVVIPTRFRPFLFALTMMALALFVGPYGPAAAAPAEAPPEPRAAAPPLRRGAGAAGIPFVDDRRCVSCHPAEAARWSGSHHAKAMMRASADSVLGDFDDARFANDDLDVRFFRREGGYFVNARGPDGERADFEITHTFGIEPLQQYLVPLPGGRLQAFSVAWDVEAKRWFDLYPDDRIEPGDSLHWTGRYQRWNLMCAECHSTDLRKRYDEASDTYATTWSEMNVGCQACHGPGGRHAEWASSSADRPSGGDRGLVVESALWRDSRRQVEACARCHARAARAGPQHRHGRPLLEDHVPALLDPGLYEVDGQVREEVFVYGSFVQSRMHAMGVGCLDCHDPHGAQLLAEGDALCTRCHGPEPPARFPTLSARRYDVTEHHHHPSTDASARCVACHMPARTYMVVDPRRDHSLRVPRPDLSHLLGVRNACNECHVDRSSRWAADRVEEWHGSTRSRGAEFAKAFFASRRGDASAGGALRELAMDETAAGIVRASALAELGLGGGPDAETLARAASDDDGLVRLGAARALRSQPPSDQAALAAPLLTDPLRAVRIEAARSIAPLRTTPAGEGIAEALDRALAEYRAAQLASADRVESQLNLAILESALGRTEAAERRYRKSIAMDPLQLPGYANLAQLLSAAGRRGAAEAVLRDGLAHLPAEGELHYSLGLLIAEQGRLADALPSLAEAARLMPERARVHYNLGLARMQLGGGDEGERPLRRARDLEPTNPDFVYALVSFYAGQQRWREALEQARALQRLVPPSPRLTGLVQQLEAKATGGPRAQ